MNSLPGNGRSRIVRYVPLVLIVILVGCSSKRDAYGAASTVTDKACSVSSAVNEVSYEKKVRLHGTVGAVCPDDGCWMVLHDGANVIRVDLSDQIVSQQPRVHTQEVTVEGVVRQKMIEPNSVGYEAYAHSCQEQTALSRKLNPGVVFEAYRLEMK